jgi:hypothetical protein
MLISASVARYKGWVARYNEIDCHIWQIVVKVNASFFTRE